MKGSRFSEEQIVGVLKEAEAGVPMKDLCRRIGISEATQRTFVPFLPPVPPAPAVHPDQPAGASLAEPCLFPHDTHRFSLRPRAYHFFASTTFSASRSSACCATIFFSRPFSSSN